MYKLWVLLITIFIASFCIAGCSSDNDTSENDNSSEGESQDAGSSSDTGNEDSSDTGSQNDTGPESGDTGSGKDGSQDTGDASTGVDANEPEDAELPDVESNDSESADGETGDEGVTDGSDTSMEDTNAEDVSDSTEPPEDSSLEDTGDLDSGVADGEETDTSVEDSGDRDTGIEDTGTNDTGETDTGTTDTGANDTGTTDTGTIEPPPASDFNPPSGKATGPSEYGPWTMRLMVAISTDGLNFTRTNRIVSDQADVPELVLAPNGWLYLYYTGWTVDNEFNKTVVAISADNGVTWSYKKLTWKGFDNITLPVDPDVQLLSDGTFRLYGTADANDGIGQRTYYTESANGIDFEKKGVAFVRPGQSVLDPSTIVIGNVWYFFAGGVPQGNWHGTSIDGTAFTFDELKYYTHESKDYLMSNGIPVPGGYRFYGFSNAGTSIASFFTQDGVTWTDDSGYRLELDTNFGLESMAVKDPAVVRLSDGSYLMVYVTKIP